MRSRGSAVHALVGAYVLDAVADRERAGFERHLPGCEQCRDDVRGLREATARLAEASAVVPRPQLREQTLRAAARTRQSPPSPAEPPDGTGGRRKPRTVAGWRYLSRGAGRWSWPARIALAAAAVMAAGAIGLGVHAGDMQRTLTAAEQRDAAIASVLGARDAVSRAVPVSGGGMARVVLSHRAHALVFIASGLARLPASRAYELWLMGPAGDRPAGMLPPARHGMRGPVVISQVTSGERLGLTVEPSAGSRRPTSAPLVLVGLGG